MKFSINTGVGVLTLLTTLVSATYFTAEDLVSWPRPSTISLSPNKKLGLYFTTSYDISTRNTTVNAFILKFPKSGKGAHTPSKTYNVTRLFSSLKGGLNHPLELTWLDGDSLTFVSDGHLWSLDVPENLDNVERDPSVITSPSIISPFQNLLEVSDLTYHSKSQSLVFSAKVKERSYRRDFGDSAMVFDQLFVRHWDKFNDPLVKRQLHYAKVTKGKDWNSNWVMKEGPRNLLRNTELESPVAPFGDASDYSLSPDGKELVFISKAPGRDQAWSTKVDVYVVPIDGGHPAKSLTQDNQGACSQPKYSPNGKYIAWLQMITPQYEADKNQIMIYHRKSGKLHQIAAWWDRSPATLEWSANSKNILLTASEYGRKRIFVVSPKSDRVRRVTKYDSASGIQHLKGDLFIATFSSLTSPPEFYLIELEDNFHVIRQSDINYSRAKGHTLSEPEDFWFNGSDGDEVHGLLLRPPNFNRWRKYPLAFLIHGGPQSAWEDSWSTRWNPNVIANAGYFVVAINPHGSTGYGQNFTDAIRKDWGGKPFKDLMLGLDYVLEEYENIDKQRVCAMGGSYGGYMINWINGHTDRFRCLVNHDGMFDATSAYYTTDELYFNEHDFGGVPWESPEKFNKFSPSSYVWKWSTPTMIIHSAKDYRLVDGEGLAAFTALQRRGIPSRLVYFPDENHWVIKRANSLRWHYEVFGWINRYCRPYQYFGLNDTTTAVAPNSTVTILPLPSVISPATGDDDEESEILSSPLQDHPHQEVFAL